MGLPCAAKAAFCARFCDRQTSDSWTRNPEGAQNTFDLLGSKEKELIWMEGGATRFKDGYNFGRCPEKILAFFDRYRKHAVDCREKLGVVEERVVA